MYLNTLIRKDPDASKRRDLFGMAEVRNIDVPLVIYKFKKLAGCRGSTPRSVMPVAGCHRVRPPRSVMPVAGCHRVRPPRSVMPVAGVEPARYRYHRILSPARLPIPSHRHIGVQRVNYIILFQKMQEVI